MHHGKGSGKEEIDALLHLLEDGRPHAVAELAARINLPGDTVTAVVRFLAAYSFITYDETRKIAVISPGYTALS
jgi:DNA-binding IclR family transcriptional regulator